jgi:tyrosyl-tRNA synthetase
LRASEVLFGKEISGLNVSEILDIFADVPSTELEKAKLAGDGFTLSDALVVSGLAPSKGEAKRLVQGGGVCVNNRRVSDPRQAISSSDLIDDQVLVLRKGAKSYHLIRVVA